MEEELNRIDSLSKVEDQIKAAIDEEDLGKLKSLIGKYPASLTREDKIRGITFIPLQYAAQEGKVKVVKAMVGWKKAKRINLDINAFNDDGTALHAAVENNRIQIVKDLCDAGVNLGITYHGIGDTAFHVAMNHNNLSIVKLLIYYIDKNAEQKKEDGLSAVQKFITAPTFKIWGRGSDPGDIDVRASALQMSKGDVERLLKTLSSLDKTLAKHTLEKIRSEVEGKNYTHYSSYNPSKYRSKSVGSYSI